MNPRHLFTPLLLGLAMGTAQAADIAAVLDWSQRVELSTPVSGVVGQVAVQPGQTVRKGDLLLSLDATLFQAAVAEQRAETERLTQEEADAGRELERVRELYARTVSSTTELDAAKLRHARASTQLAAAQARLERARRQLEESELRAPFDAVILARQAEPGMVVAAGCQPPGLLGVARADEIVAVGEVMAEQVARLRLGTRLGVTVEGRSYGGTLRSLTYRADGRYGVAVSFARPAELVAGMKAVIRASPPG